MEHCHIEQELHVVLGLLPRLLAGAIAKAGQSLARLLFHKHLEVELQHVHSPLYSKHLAEERRFEHYLVGVESPYFLRHHVVNYVADVLHLLLSLGMEPFAKPGSTRSHGKSVVPAKPQYAVLVGKGTVMDGIVKHLAREITQDDC